MPHSEALCTRPAWVGLRLADIAAVLAEERRKPRIGATGDSLGVATGYIRTRGTPGLNSPSGALADS